MCLELYGPGKADQDASRKRQDEQREAASCLFDGEIVDVVVVSLIRGEAGLLCHMLVVPVHHPSAYEAPCEDA